MGLAVVPHQQNQLAIPVRRSSDLATIPASQGAATAVPAAEATVTVVSIMDLVRYFRKRWKLAVAIALPAAIAAFVAIGMGKKEYEAEARLLLRIQDTNVFNFNEMAQNRITELSAPMLVNNHRSELKSRRYVNFLWDSLPEKDRMAFIAEDLKKNGVRSWHRALREKLGLAEPLRPLAAQDLFGARMEKAVRVEPLKESHVLRIQVRHENPVLASTVANHFVEDYIRYVSEQELGNTKTASHFLEQKSAELQKRLTESEKVLASYRQSENLIQDSEVKDVFGEKVRLLTAALSDAEVRQTKARHDWETIKSAQTVGRDLLEVKVIADNSDVSAIRKQLDLKMAERAPLTADCGPRHPKMRALNEAIATLQSTLQKNIADVVAMVQNDAGMGDRPSQVAEFQRQLEEARTQALSVSGKTVQQNLLRDQVNMDRELYQKIKLRMNQAELTSEFKDNGLLRVADNAGVPSKPVSPSTTLAAIASMMLFGLIFLGVPVGAGLAEDHLMPAIRASREKVAAAAPVTPAAPAAAEPAASEAGYTLAPITHSGTAAVVETDESVVAVLPDVHAPNHASLLIAMMRTGAHGAGTALRQLGVSLEKNRWARTGPGIVLVTSAEAREGKSLIANALAATFCSQGRKAFLIECNPASPSAHQWLPNVRSDSADAEDIEALRYGSTNLFVLPASGLPSNQMCDLIDGYRFWIDRARQAGVDWVILDAAPLLHSFADVAPLVPLATDLLFVHDQAISSKAQVNAALNLIRPMMPAEVHRGLVMNRQAA